MMPSITIDDDTYNLLKQHALPLEDASAVIKRIFMQKTGKSANNKEQESTKSWEEDGKRVPKTSVPHLIKASLLADGQKVYLYDYQHNILKQYEATIAGNKLRYEGKLYSLSALAGKLLKKAGYKNDIVRGPARWCTEQGISIRSLWSEYLKNHPEG